MVVVEIELLTAGDCVLECVVGHPADWQVCKRQTGGLSVVNWIGCDAACQKSVDFVLQECGVGPKQ